MRVTRVLNNNAVVATDPDGQHVVALGRGLGHGRRPGDLLDPARVEQVFVDSGDAVGRQLTQFLSDVPIEYVRVASRIAELASQRLGLTVTQSLILPLADHVHFAVQRQRQGMHLQAPLRWEVRQLYPAELAVGEAAVQQANAMLGVQLNPDEAVSIALHLVNAQFATPGLSHVVEMTEVITQVTALVERTLQITVDQDSMSLARFVTHLRYLFTRVAGGTQLTEPEPSFGQAIANAHPEAMACAVKVRFLIEMGVSTTLTSDETAYLAMHIARLAWDVRGRSERGPRM
ncbi:MAG: PRD domain-containing protein [Actinomycetales bacterium]